MKQLMILSLLCLVCLQMLVGASVQAQDTVTDQATVYVAHDEKLAKKPDWLADWKDTGESFQGGFLGNERSFRLYEKAFPKEATVKLGPNGPKLETQEKSKLEPWIYLTIVKR
ncbi:MAG: hypothetical protein FJ178_01545 [Gammaproteobacteria bacterium]|nr:hypothetical protein [Gammaproteobacteria bacterium]